MLATADCANHYTEQIIYESSWTDNTSNGVSWFNLLTAQSIPEETDVTDISHTPVRNHSASSCSSSSIESCYVVLEIQRPRSLTETSSTVGKDDEDDEEEMEEMEEEIEELHFAQVNTDAQEIDCDQLAVSMTIQVPMEEHVLEHLQEQVHEVEEYAEASQPVIEEPLNDMLFDKAKSLSKFTKRMKAMSHMSKTEQRHSTSSDDDSSNSTKLKKMQPVNEYHPTVNSTVLTESQPMVQAKNVVGRSNTSLDSIENKLTTSALPVQTRTTTTFSDLSLQRTSNPMQIQRSGPKMGTTTLTRTFAFDRACMEKYGQAQEQTTEPTAVAPATAPIAQKDIGLPPRKSRPPEPPAPKDDALQRRSLANTTPNPSHVDSEGNAMDDSECFHHPSNPSTTIGSHGLAKTSSVLCLMKKCARTVTSEYRLSTAHGNIPAEPTLLQVTYLDGRLPLKTTQTGELSRRTQTLSNSIATRLNKLGLSKMSSTQDLPSASTALNKSYRKRVFSRFRNLLESGATESAQSIPWQHKTITELFHEKRQKL